MSSFHTPDPVFSPEIVKYHSNLLGIDAPKHPGNDASLAPMIAGSALRHLCNDNANCTRDVAPSLKLQYGLLAGFSDSIQSIEAKAEPQEEITDKDVNDPRLFSKITPPSSTFICGSQGSGKSHTLSCMLEAGLIPSSKLGRLPNQLTGVVFHYDTFISDVQGQPCESAYLASNADVSVRILCAPTNVASIKRTYASLNVTIEPLQIDQSHLDTKRMMDLMAVTDDDVPLYMESVKRFCVKCGLFSRQRRVVGSITASFGDGLMDVGLRRARWGYYRRGWMRWIVLCRRFKQSSRRLGTKNNGTGTDWTAVPGRLTIVGRSCPCISPPTTCLLFNICLELFLQPHDTSVGRVVALDEAHKYMTTSPESTVFTETLLLAVRLQRHLGARIIVSTQEPTVATALLDLCSTTIVHRFTSPDWMKALKGHLAARQEDHHNFDSKGESPSDKMSMTLFERILPLKVGEALLFAPSAVVGARESDGDERRGVEFERLGGRNLMITVRGRLTDDGGKSILSH